MTYMTVLYRVRSVNTPRLRLTYYNARRVPIVSNVPVWVDIILMQDRLRIAAKWDGGGGKNEGALVLYWWPHSPFF